MSRREVSVVLFEGFELLDVFGPVSLFNAVPEVAIRYLGPTAGPVASAQGAQVVAEYAYAQAAPPDIVLVPGGIGTRTVARDSALLELVAAYGASARRLAWTWRRR